MISSSKTKEGHLSPTGLAKLICETAEELGRDVGNIGDTPQDTLRACRAIIKIKNYALLFCEDLHVC